LLRLRVFSFSSAAAVEGLDIGIDGGGASGVLTVLDGSL
jgi:hypothetical protein